MKYYNDFEKQDDVRRKKDEKIWSFFSFCLFFGGSVRRLGGNAEMSVDDTQRLLLLSNLRFYTNASLLIARQAQTPQPSSFPAGHRPSSFSSSQHAGRRLGLESESGQSSNEEAKEVELFDAVLERSRNLDEAIRCSQSEVKDAQERLQSLKHIKEQLLSIRDSLPEQATQREATTGGESWESYLFGQFLPEHFPEATQPPGTLTLAGLLECLLAQQGWLEIDSRFWPPHLELLLRSCIIITHPDDFSLIRLRSLD